MGHGEAEIDDSLNWSPPLFKPQLPTTNTSDDEHAMSVLAQKPFIANGLRPKVDISSSLDLTRC